MLAKPVLYFWKIVEKCATMRSSGHEASLGDLLDSWIEKIDMIVCVIIKKLLLSRSYYYQEVIIIKKLLLSRSYYCEVIMLFHMQAGS
jgi:hypothetical protein